MLGLAVLLAALWGIFTLIAKHQSFVESHDQVQSDKLTSNVRVVQLSDLHLHEFGDHNADLIERITALKPDIIAITGDMNDKLVDDYSVVTDLCTELVKIAPVYYVPGNHEWPKIVFHNSPIGTDLEAIGVHFLADETETLEVNGNTIAIGGVAEAPASYERYASAYFESFEQLDAFKLLLVHYPEYFLEDGFFSDVPVDLALCGHAHGGMIRIPGIGGLYTPDQGFLPTLTAGLHQIGTPPSSSAAVWATARVRRSPASTIRRSSAIVDINWF